MRNTKTDDKNIQLLKLIAQLRDHIDLHRIIGLNATELRDRDILVVPSLGTFRNQHRNLSPSTSARFLSRQIETN